MDNLINISIASESHLTICHITNKPKTLVGYYWAPGFNIIGLTIYMRSDLSIQEALTHFTHRGWSIDTGKIIDVTKIIKLLRFIYV